MPWLENWPRPYYVKYEKVPVKNHQDWYDVYRLPGDVYCIAEPQHAQEVNVFLVMGKERALLIDTGMNIRDLKPLVEELWEGEVIAANTHCHFDHIGADPDFAPVWICDDDTARHVAERGIFAEDTGEEMTDPAFQFGPPAGFDADSFRIPPYEYRTFTEGHTFDLGGRTVEVIRTPGHSPDSVTFWDKEANIFWTGDLVYLGAIFAHIEGELFGDSDYEDYLASLRRLAALADEDSKFYTSHNDLIMDYGTFCRILGAFEEVAEKEAGETSGGEPHLHEFGDFRIICKPGLK